MFAATTTMTNSKFDGRSKFQRALDRDSAKTQPQQEAGLDDGAVSVFADGHFDRTTPIFRRTSTTPSLFDVELAGEWVRA